MRVTTVNLPKDIPADEAEILNAAANSEDGSRSKVRALLRRKPEIARSYPTLARSAERRLVETWGDQVLRQEIMRAQLRAMQASLTEPNDGELERLIVENATLAWIALNQAEATRASCWKEGLTTDAAEFWNRHVGKLRTDFLRTCKTLATVRRLRVPNVQVNIAGKQVNIAGSPLPSC